MALVGRALGRPRTRAEQVRRRRARGRGEGDTASHSRRAAAFGPLAGSPRLGATARPRRRRSLPLPVEVGAEVSLPTLPRVRIGPRAASGLLLGMWALTLHSAWTGPRFEVSDIEILGTKLMSAAQVRSIADLRGLPAFAVDPRSVEARLESHAEIDGAEVHIRWPNRVSIEVQERRPVLEWLDGTQTWWLNAAGVAFIQREPYPGLVRIVAERPVLEIDADALLPAIQPEVIWEAVAVAERMPHLGDLSYDKADGIGFQDPRGWTVIVGQGGDLDAKLEVYNALASQLVERGVNVSLINVADPTGPFYRLAR